MSDAYTVLARRYRSQTFDELVGQEAIAQTLKNAIKSNRVAHAFMFTGTRGVGKTSAARILAKAINCPNRTPDGDPCGICNSCTAIARGDDMDVIEIDGASNNGVDNIRELRQAAGIRPARSPYKIYIIDEVHMVTTAAFNALLKTLEEPPEHIKFIFATTEIGKVPATILSRCQRFDFRPISAAKIAEHLTEIVKDEKMEVEPAALHRIARLGNGSMRDAISLLDRFLSMGEKRITEKMVEDLLGRPPVAAIAQLVSAIANSDAAAAITQADTLLKEGMGVEQLLSELIDFLRNLMLVAACGNQTELLDVPTEARTAYTTLAAKFDAPTLVHLIALCEQTLRSLKASTMQRALLDALIVRLALSEQFSSIKELLTQSDSSADPAAKKKSDVAPPGKAGPTSEPATDSTQPHDSPRLAGVTARCLRTDLSSKQLPQDTITTPPHAPPPLPEESAESEKEENIYEVMKGHMRRKQEEIDAQNAQLKQQTNGRPGPPKIGVTPYGKSLAPVPPSPKPVEKVADLTDMKRVWLAARNYLTANAGYLESVLGGISRIRSLNVQTGETTLLIPLNQKSFVNDKARAKLEEALRTVCGLPVKLELEFIEQTSPPPGQPGTNGAGTGSISAQRIPPEVLEKVKNQPIIQELMKRLDATVTQVELLGTGNDE